VEEAMAGRGHQIKESTIGIEALGRGESFDPRLDPIVRTQAAKLRARLLKYYDIEGHDDSLRIQFHKGSYAPLFRARAPMVSPVPPLRENLVEAQATTSSEISASKKRVYLRWNSVAAAAAFLALVGLGSAGFYAFWSGRQEQVLSANPPSIAVMPFANLSDRTGDEFLSDGLADELISSLRRVPALRVVARTSAFTFKGKPMDVREIGRQLHVRTVLIGSILKYGDRFRISVQLNSAADNAHLWSGSYDCDSEHMRTITQEIAGAVTAALGVGQAARRAMNRLDEQTFPMRASPNASAYRNYLRGLYFWNKLTLDSLKVAIHSLEDAIAEDPSFARAYAALADCYVMAPYVGAAPSPEVVSKIWAAASRALELDGTLGEAHFDLAIWSEYHFDWATAETEFKKGLVLSPSSVTGHLWYAKYLAIVGRKDEVLIHRRTAAELDPVSPYAVQAVGGYLSVTGRYDEAIEQFLGALALDPNFGLAHQGLGVAYLLKGLPAQAIDELQKADSLMSGPRRRALLGYAYGVAGNTFAAHRILSEFLEQSSNEQFPALAVAQVYLGLGDKDHAFEWLEKAIDQRDLEVTLQWDSPYESLRSDPRFPALLRRMQLAN
jgi:TolB-like protein/Tfp pilus assembly protein PilF